jgi:exosortase N
MNTTLMIPSATAFQRRLLAFMQPLRRGAWRRWRRILAIVYLPLIAVGVYGYFNSFSASLVLGALALAYAPAFGEQKSPGFRFGWPALALSALFFVAPLKTVVYVALICAVCLYRESFFRRVPATTLFILALLTPIANYFANTFSFPIRLGLTSLAGFIIRIGGGDSTVEGNTITFRNHLFSVDPACMGLHMLIFSLLCALLVMNYYQRQEQRRLSFLPIACLLLLTTVLNIIANLVRIVCLVLLLILPDNPLHGIFGLLLLCAYVLLPLLPMIRYTIHRFGHPVLPANGSPTVRSRWVLAGNLVVATALIVVTTTNLLKKEPLSTRFTTNAIPGYTLRNLPNNILQLDNGPSMVYIKPIPGFYYTDHTPSICWEGSGYTFHTLRESTRGGIRVFEGSLEKGREILYTAWWYDNGVQQTINPFQWRWDLIRGGAPYAVVNVTTTTQPQLEVEIAHILSTHAFQPILGHASPASSVKIR